MEQSRLTDSPIDTCTLSLYGLQSTQYSAEYNKCPHQHAGVGHVPVAGLPGSHGLCREESEVGAGDCYRPVTERARVTPLQE